MLRFVSIALIASLGACSDICSNTEVSRSTSPDRRLDAVLYQRNCGATTGFSTQIALVPVGNLLSGDSALYRADDDHGAARTGVWGGPWAEIEWLTSNKLLVRYAAKSRIFQQNTNAYGISVSYQVDVR
jgi:hypothetical protein